MYNIPYGTSVLTLIFIAYERYCAVCKPAYFNEFKGRVRWFVPLAWLASACMNIPNIVYCGIRTDTKKNQLTCDCTERWPSLRAKSIYGIGVVVVLYVLPLVVTSRLYFLVIRRLRRSIPGEQQGTVTAYQSRQGVVKMLLVCVVLFFVAWTPYNVLFFLKRLQYDYRRIYKYVKNERLIYIFHLLIS